MSIWLWRRWVKRYLRRNRWLEVRRMPVGFERPAIERGYTGAELVEKWTLLK